MTEEFMTRSKILYILYRWFRFWINYYFNYYL